MRRLSVFGLALMFLVASGAAHANMGVPMIAVVMPAFVVALIPVIVIEAYVYRRAGFAWGWALSGAPSPMARRR